MSLKPSMPVTTCANVDERETRIIIQTHPDLIIVPPDPPQLMIKIGQVRQVIHSAYYRPPVRGGTSFSRLHPARVYERAAHSLLKVLEEPPRPRRSYCWPKIRRSCCPPSAGGPSYIVSAPSRRSWKPCSPTVVLNSSRTSGRSPPDWPRER